ncbi:MAG: haloalkane dehalogenase [Polyangiaceae bacterium]|nr:haloalkane dehalogenase [Polyangiaceae bacterium]
MKWVRTPEERFGSLPDFPYEPKYVQIPSGEEGALRMAYIDEGPRNGQVVLLLHGEPSWSYLYRKMIPILTGAGLRAVAPDLIGFGRSDKPVDRANYTYQRHVDWVKAFLSAADLEHVTLFCQDWGGLIGLRIVGEEPDRFARVVASNTFLPTGDQKVPEAFFAWRNFSQTVPEFPVGFIIKSGSARDISPEVMAAYDAPFPDESYKAGARAFPTLVPVTPDDPASEPNRKAWQVLRTFTKPFLTLFGDSDPITRGGDLVLQKQIPGANGQPHATLTRAGHFIQEDDGETLAGHVVEFCKR